MKLSNQDIDKVRHIEGFPIAKDDDIIALSDPPNYTACPNPFIYDFIKQHGKPYNEEMDAYNQEPFATDISEGKSDPIYAAFSYHTKVPYKAILKYILHYTKPGDIILDGFAGTGMTALAAQMCGNLSKQDVFEYKKDLKSIDPGIRYAIVNDLSPYASLLSASICQAVDIEDFSNEVKKLMEEVERRCDWLYLTKIGDSHINGEGKYAKINHVIWSNVYICPNCSREFSLWEQSVSYALNNGTGTQDETFNCKYCNAELSSKDLENAFEILYDVDLNREIKTLKRIPIFINYTYGNKRDEKYVDKSDLELLELISNEKIEYWYPTERMCEGREGRRNDKLGITHVHLFFSKRALNVLSCYLHLIQNSKYKNILYATLLSALARASIRNRYMPKHGNKHVGTLSGTLYIPNMQEEINLIDALSNRLNKVIRALTLKSGVANNSIVSCNSSTNLSVSDNSIDYIFTDPPFGSNIDYSELNYIFESWLKVKTNNIKEAIVNISQGKGLLEYQNLMLKCFQEYYRVLKPNRWMTVEFSNSKNAVWIAIQEALNRAGFIVADIRILDKKKGTTKQLTYASAVKQDLIISAYKPKESLRAKVLEHVGTPETAWDFIREHLLKLPVVTFNGEKIEIIRERESFMLYDRMLSYHIINDILIPIDASDFYKGLSEKFLTRDNMYFLHDQINEYDTARIATDVENIQFELFVSNEKTAISWLYQQLSAPQAYSEIMPKFMQEVRSIEKHEKLPELSILLEDNFLLNEHDKWYIPDVTKTTDIIKLREKRLVKEFEEYLNSVGKLKLFRTEAVRAGFAKLWKEKNYSLIVKTADRLPEYVIQEDDKLLMYYDVSLNRVG